MPLALTLVLGANVGGGLMAVGLTFERAGPARRVLYGNLAFRAVGALVVFLALGPITGACSGWAATPAGWRRISTRSSTSRSSSSSCR